VSKQVIHQGDGSSPTAKASVIRKLPGGHGDAPVDGQAAPHGRRAACSIRFPPIRAFSKEGAAAAKEAAKGAAKGAAKVTAPSPNDVMMRKAGSCGVWVPKAYPKAPWSAVVLLLTSWHQLNHLVTSGNFATWDAHLLDMHTTLLLFYPREVNANSALLHAAFGEEALEGGGRHPLLRPFLYRGAEKLREQMGLQACRGEGSVVNYCNRWSTPFGNVLLTCLTPIKVPTLYGGSLINASKTHLPSFCNDKTGEYVVASKWYTAPMLSLDVISRFDMWIKLDYDVCFHKRVRPAQALAAQRRFFFHTALVRR